MINESGYLEWIGCEKRSEEERQTKKKKKMVQKICISI